MFSAHSCLISSTVPSRYVSVFAHAQLVTCVLSKTPRDSSSVIFVRRILARRPYSPPPPPPPLCGHTCTLQVSYVAGLSLANMGGRLFWASASDKIGEYTFLVCLLLWHI